MGSPLVQVGLDGDSLISKMGLSTYEYGWLLELQSTYLGSGGMSLFLFMDGDYLPLRLVYSCQTCHSSCVGRVPKGAFRERFQATHTRTLYSLSVSELLYENPFQYVLMF